MQDKALTRHQGGPPATQQRQGGQVRRINKAEGGKKGSGMPSVRLDVNLVSWRQPENIYKINPSTPRLQDP